MSPRIKRLRKVLNPPPITGFKPYGQGVNADNPEPVLIGIEEYEALRLCDYDNLNHHDASVTMGVSRPTFTRIYASVRAKIAKAFVEGRTLKIEGGKVYFDTSWLVCGSCDCYFNNPEKDKPVYECPLCGSHTVSHFETADIELFLQEARTQDICICTSCGFEKQHQYGLPCATEVCPQCSSLMKRKRKPKL